MIRTFPPFITIILIVLFPISLFCQRKSITDTLDQVKFIVHYNLRYQPDSTQNEEKSQEPMILLIGSKVSHFLSQTHWLRGEAAKQIQSHEALIGFLNNPQRIKPKITYEIYKNSPPNHLSFIQLIPNSYHKYTEPISPFHWEITTETKQHGNYIIQKATTNYGGRSWEAWFTPSLPFNDGPYKFCGLPGLILFVKDSRNHYVFEFTHIEVPSCALFIENRKSSSQIINTTRANFARSMQRYHASPFIEGNIHLHRESQLRVTDNLRRRNNPIELSADD